MGRCERCRTEFASGTAYGGHDYCMTCYSKIRQDEETRRQQAEQLRQDKIEYRKRELREEYAAQDRERERQKHEAASESRRQEAVQEKKRREAQAEDMRKKQKWPEIKHHYAVEGTAPLQIFSPFLKKKKPAQQPAQGKAEELPPLSLRPLQAPKKEGKARQKAQAPLPEKPSLSLSVSEGLPASLSVGQKQVQVLLVGKNSSSSPMPAGLEVSILDSQKSAIAAKPEPRSCTIGPEGESKFKVTFDLPEDAARGRLTFSAVLEENAIYVDRQPPQSNKVSLSSQVGPQFPPGKR